MSSFRRRVILKLPATDFLLLEGLVHNTVKGFKESMKGVEPNPDDPHTAQATESFAIAESVDKKLQSKKVNWADNRRTILKLSHEEYIILESLILRNLQGFRKVYEAKKKEDMQNPQADLMHAYMKYTQVHKRLVSQAGYSIKDAQDPSKPETVIETEIEAKVEPATETEVNIETKSETETE